MIRTALLAMMLSTTSVVALDSQATTTRLPLAPPTSTPSEAEIRRRVDALLAQMTPEEKIGQLMISFHFMTPPATMPPVVAAIESGRLGSVLFVSDPAQANALQRAAVERSRLKIPLMFGYDVTHGLRTIFPVPIGMAASWDPVMVERAQHIAAIESRAAGIQWTFAPNVDIARDPRWGRMVEGAGSDPYLGAAMAAAQVRGFQGAGIGKPDTVIAGPKHFAGYGAATGGRDYEEANLSENELWNTYLPPFEAAVKAGAGNIMTAYMPLNGVPATGNTWLLQDVLRGQWGFKGFVVGDAGAIDSLTTHGFARDRQDAAVRALAAGVDMEMGFLSGATATLPKSVAENRISQDVIDKAVRRILET